MAGKWSVTILWPDRLDTIYDLEKVDADRAFTKWQGRHPSIRIVEVYDGKGKRVHVWKRDGER